MPRVDVGLAIAGAGVAVSLLYAIAYRRLAAHARHVHPGPATSDLRPEPPAVVNLLVNDLRLTPDSVAATVLDLAARRRLEIFEVGPETSVLRVPDAHDSAPATAGSDLAPYEVQLLQLAGSAAAGGRGTGSRRRRLLGSRRAHSPGLGAGHGGGGLRPRRLGGCGRAACWGRCGRRRPQTWRQRSRSGRRPPARPRRRPCPAAPGGRRPPLRLPPRA